MTAKAPDAPSTPTDVTKAPPASESPAPATENPAPAAPQDDPDDPDAPPVAAGESPEENKAEAAPPDTSKIAAEVSQKRDVKQLAALVRDKKRLEEETKAAKAERDKYSVYAQVDRLLEDGDEAGAIEALLAAKFGDQARARLASTYDGLTSKILGEQSKPVVPAKVERSVSRLEKQIEELKQEKAQAEAKEREREAAESLRAEQSAISQVGDWLSLETQNQAFPYLLTEADDPADFVWAIAKEADEKGIKLTIQEAAQLANEHFKPTVEKKKDRYRNLLEPNKASGTPSKPEPTKSQNGQSRKSLTNADASKPPAQDKPPPKPRTEEERRELSWAKLREGHRNQ